MTTQVELAESGAISFRQRAMDYVDLVKPRILLLNLLTTLGAMSMASNGQWPSIHVILSTLGGMALAVGAGGSLNCFIERDRDALMVRTANRPLPSGRMKPLEALIFGSALWMAAYFILYWFVNPPTAFLTMLAFGCYVGLYTPLKTRTPLCTLIGAVPGALPPLIGWTAVRGHVELSGFLLFAILFVWQIPHFLALALLRRDEYAQAGMPMYPVIRGERATVRQILLYTIALIPVSLLPYGILGASRAYLILAAVLGLGFLMMAIRGIVFGGSPSWCRKIFSYSVIYLVILFSALVFDS